jgi:hypothetical protein
VKEMHSLDEARTWLSNEEPFVFPATAVHPRQHEQWHEVT